MKRLGLPNVQLSWGPDERLGLESLRWIRVNLQLDLKLRLGMHAAEHIFTSFDHDELVIRARLQKCGF